MRRQNRREAQQEKQDRIRLGLLPEDQPRLTKSNFMRVLGEEAILEPSAIEAKMHQQVLDRQQKHLQLIEESKLTPEERREKKRLKLKEDTSTLVHVCLFKIIDLSHPQHKFKVNQVQIFLTITIQNAKQYNLTGAALITPDLNLVVVEGGPKGINQYKKLMQRRIDWTQYQSSSDTPNQCILVWEVTQKVYSRAMCSKEILGILKLGILKIPMKLKLTLKNSRPYIIGNLPKTMLMIPIKFSLLMFFLYKVFILNYWSCNDLSKISK